MRCVATNVDAIDPKKQRKRKIVAGGQNKVCPYFFFFGGIINIQLGTKVYPCEHFYIPEHSPAAALRNRTEDDISCWLCLRSKWIILDFIHFFFPFLLCSLSLSLSLTAMGYVWSFSQRNLNMICVWTLILHSSFLLQINLYILS